MVTRHVNEGNRPEGTFPDPLGALSEPPFWQVPAFWAVSGESLLRVPNCVREGRGIQTPF